jgi:regulatory protein YycH of two-component signal transduction system YycFG
MTILFPIIYSAALTYLVWKAFKVMSNGWNLSETERKPFITPNFKQKKYTIHPELLDKSGNITEEELLTVRFSNDNDPNLEKGSTTD